MSQLPKVETASPAQLSKTPVQTAVFLVSQGSSGKPQATHGVPADLVAQLEKEGSFSAKFGQFQLLKFHGPAGASHLFLAGVGKPSALSAEKFRVLGANIWKKLSSEKSATFAVFGDALRSLKGLPKSAGGHIGAAGALVEGMLLASYQFNKYKNPDPDRAPFSPSKLIFTSQSVGYLKSVRAPLERAVRIAECISIARDWSNEPSNEGTPAHFASEAQKLAKQYGIKCKVLTEADCKKEKMELFLGVGQGSEREGYVVVLEYSPKKPKKNAKTIALVGKGITFDSGGISIKPSLRMEEMKHDMTGAATVFGATLLAAATGCPNKITTFMAFTENMPSGIAIQPGNIIRGRSGKTVEIVNTDAEGRLILADVLDYAQDFKPHCVVDAATLTGAVVIALGNKCCAIMGNDEPLIKKIQSAGTKHDERLWQLPMFDEYAEDMKSPVADIRNAVNNSLGGSIRGGMFLKEFIRKETKWAHLDIAATAHDLPHLAYCPKTGASGTYVRTLAEFASTY